MAYGYYNFICSDMRVDFLSMTNERLRQSIEQLTKDTAAEWQAGYEAGIKAGIKAAANALEADAKMCDCAALEANECACGAWDDYKSITSARAVEIVNQLKGTR